MHNAVGLLASHITRGDKALAAPDNDYHKLTRGFQVEYQAMEKPGDGTAATLTRASHADHDDPMSSLRPPVLEPAFVGRIGGNQSFVASDAAQLKQTPDAVSLLSNASYAHLLTL